MRFREVQFCGTRRGRACGKIRSDRILPEAEAHEDMRWHVQSMGGIRRKRGVAAGGLHALRPGRGAMRSMYHVMRDSGMIGILLQQRLKNRDGLFLERKRMWLVCIGE